VKFKVPLEIEIDVVNVGLPSEVPWIF